MCGRFNLRTPTGQLIEIFRLANAPQLKPRFNIAPTQRVACVRAAETQRELSLLFWGLIPFWAKDVKIGNRMINARAETVATKPAFRVAFKQRRCLIPADGFYEWAKTAGSSKQPFHISMHDGQTFAFAGLWESWQDETDKPIESCTIITTSANPLMAEIHDRMPVILPEPAWDPWLDPEWEARDTLESLLLPYAFDQLVAVPVSLTVNNPRNDTATCIEPPQT